MFEYYLPEGVGDPILCPKMHKFFVEEEISSERIDRNPEKQQFQYHASEHQKRHKGERKKGQGGQKRQ